MEGWSDYKKQVFLFMPKNLVCLYPINSDLFDFMNYRVLHLNIKKIPEINERCHLTIEMSLNIQKDKLSSKFLKKCPNSNP